MLRDMLVLYDKGETYTKSILLTILRIVHEGIIESDLQYDAELLEYIQCGGIVGGCNDTTHVIR